MIQAAHSKDIESMAPEAPSRVLLIEDDDAQSRAMIRWLEATGEFAVTSAASGYAAEAYLKSGVEWHAVVSDIDLPGMNGLQVLSFCKEHQPQAPVLMVTAHRKFDYALKAIQGQADDFMVKPLGKQILQAKVRELIKKKAAENLSAPKEVVLAIGAHPDDVEIGCGGILANHAAKGHDVTILTLTGGEAGGTKSERVIESRQAAQALGAELRIYDLPDRSITEGPETISVIEEVIAEVRPTVIYTHSINDAHQDHRAVHRATMVAARGVPNVYCYQAPSTTVDFRPSLFMNVADQIEKKLDVIGVYATQTSVRAYLAPNHIRSTAEYWGRFSDYQAAEPLEVVRRTA